MKTEQDLELVDRTLSLQGFQEMGQLKVIEHAFGHEAAKDFLHSLRGYTLNTWLRIYIHGKYGNIN